MASAAILDKEGFCRKRSSRRGYFAILLFQVGQGFQLPRVGGGRQATVPEKTVLPSESGI